MFAVHPSPSGLGLCPEGSPGLRDAGPEWLPSRTIYLDGKGPCGQCLPATALSLRLPMLCTVSCCLLPPPPGLPVVCKPHVRSGWSQALLDPRLLLEAACLCRGDAPFSGPAEASAARPRMRRICDQRGTLCAQRALLCAVRTFVCPGPFPLAPGRWPCPSSPSGPLASGWGGGWAEPARTALECAGRSGSHLGL